ncbi:MAG: GTPase ObgE [Mycoplasmatales bacterium]
MFVDSVKIEIEAGTGGNGIVAFRREKYVDLGGPSGGSGGAGGNVYFVVDEGLRTLIDFSFNRKYHAKPGANGMNKSKQGATGNDLVLKVPPGTVVYDDDTGEFLCDLVVSNEKVLMAKGGRGGRGNLALAKAGKHVLEICENGEPGKFLNLRLELKLLADVGLVGLPSVGKSTLISVMSRVKPKIAAYHFTTLSPNLGVAKADEGRSFVVADLPGLIEGAAEGKGLGHQFLKHIERTRLILHVLDMGSFEQRDPIDDYEQINKELGQYNHNLLEREQIVVANKKDLPDYDKNLSRFKAKYPDVVVVEISGITKEGIDKLLHVTADKLDEIGNIFFGSENVIKKTYKFVEDKGISITLGEEGIFYVDGPDIERLMKMTNFNMYDNIRRFAMQLRHMGVYDMLEEHGIEPNDIVSIEGYEFEYEQ